ncbi:MAG: YggS family pyridoxal phosphate-dependent enzyme [Candidatus Eiseniibacteriota bacterium]|jgi:pyridoxal phosphate enzyme (YggS family)
MADDEQLAGRIARVRERIEAAARRAGRDPSRIRLVAVTKGFDAATAGAAVIAGLRDLGENRVQEAQQKIPRVEVPGDAPRPSWHLIGHLQTNKAGVAAGLFDWVQSVDSLRVAEALSRRREGAALAVLVQLLTSDEPTKTGIDPEAALELVPRIAALPCLEVRGLMTVPPLDSDPAVARSSFRTVRTVADRLAALRDPRVRVDELSMGMSGDFEIAIEEGSTMVRIGTALFGARPPRPRA